MTFKPNLGPAKGGLAALLEAEKNKPALAATEKKSAIAFRPSSEATERIRIIFDDSGSMHGSSIEDAREGCIEFMRNCILNQTAVAVHPMNYDNRELTQLTTNLPALSVQVKQIEATSYTPLFETWQKAQKAEPKATRFILFSDGSPDTRNGKEECIAYCIQNKIPCDTVYIDTGSIAAYETMNSPSGLMKEIAERTGGIFLVFERGKANFKTAFKYLAPTLRLQLAASTSMQQALQDGKLA